MMAVRRGDATGVGKVPWSGASLTSSGDEWRELSRSLWTHELATGIPAIDDEHRDMLDRLAKLYPHPPRSESEVRAMGTALVRYLDGMLHDHFEHEEELMWETDYPQTTEHIAAHAALQGHVRELREQLAGQTMTPTLIAVSNRQLALWLIDHTLAYDRELAEHLRIASYGDPRDC